MGLRRFRFIPGWEARVEREAYKTQLKLATKVFERAKLNVAAHIETGALFKSVHMRGAQVFIGTNHWHFIEYGTRRHVIRVNKPKRGLKLKGTGRYYAKVNHPGNREFRPMRDALESVFHSVGSVGFTSDTRGI